MKVTHCWVSSLNPLTNVASSVQPLTVSGHAPWSVTHCIQWDIEGVSRGRLVAEVYVPECKRWGDSRGHWVVRRSPPRWWWGHLQPSEWSYHCHSLQTPYTGSHWRGGGGQGVSITLNTYVSNLQVLLLRKLQCSNKHVHLYSIDHFFDVIKHPTVYKNNLLWVGGETAAELEHDVGLFSVHSPFQP